PEERTETAPALEHNVRRQARLDRETLAALRGGVDRDPRRRSAASGPRRSLHSEFVLRHVERAVDVVGARTGRGGRGDDRPLIVGEVVLGVVPGLRGCGYV